VAKTDTQVSNAAPFEMSATAESRLENTFTSPVYVELSKPLPMHDMQPSTCNRGAASMTYLSNKNVFPVRPHAMPIEHASVPPAQLSKIAAATTPTSNATMPASL
jgi:hypothetical protein